MNIFGHWVEQLSLRTLTSALTRILGKMQLLCQFQPICSLKIGDFSVSIATLSLSYLVLPSELRLSNFIFGSTVTNFRTLLEHQIRSDLEPLPSWFHINMFNIIFLVHIVNYILLNRKVFL